MTDKKDGPGQKSGAGKTPDRNGGDGSGGKRPFATIDVRAVEVKEQASKGQPQAPKAAAPPTDNAAQAPKAADAPRAQAEAAQKVVQAATAGEAAAKAAVAGAAVAGGEAASASGRRSAQAPGGSPSVPQIAEAQSRGGGFLSHVLAAVLGAGIALLGAPYVSPLLSEIGLPMPPAAAPSPALVERMARLEAGLAETRSGAETGVTAAASVTAAQKRIDDLGRMVAALQDAQAKTARVAADIEAGLAKARSDNDAPERLKKLEDQLGIMATVASAEPDRAGRLPQLALITTRLAELDQTLQTRLGDLRKDLVKEVEARTQPSNEASEAAKATGLRLDREVGLIKAENNRIATGLDQAKTTADRIVLTLKAVEDERVKLSAAVEALRHEVETRISATAKPADVTAAVSPLAAQVSALEKNLGTVVKSEGERNATAERIVLALELGNLKRAMERGVPYARELADVQRAGGAKLDLAVLDRYAGQGVATAAQLAQGFRGVANAILDADAEKGDGGVVDKLFAGAKSFVRVRKTTAAAGESGAEAAVARMEAALKAGRLGDVLAEAKALPKLPDAAKEWLAKVEARQVVDAAVAQVDETLKASLGAGAAPKKGQP